MSKSERAFPTYLVVEPDDGSSSRKTFLDADGTDQEISALTIQPITKDARFSPFVFLAFWSSHEVKAYKLPNFDLVAGTPITMPYLPRSLLLHDFGDETVGQKQYLMVGLVNGTVVAMPFDGKGGVGEKKSFGLGGSPVALSRCYINNKAVVFANGARSTVLYPSRDGISHSPVLVKVFCLMTRSKPSLSYLCAFRMYCRPRH